MEWIVTRDATSVTMTTNFLVRQLNCSYFQKHWNQKDDNAPRVLIEAHSM